MTCVALCSVSRGQRAPCHHAESESVITPETSASSSRTQVAHVPLMSLLLVVTMLFSEGANALRLPVGTRQ